MSDDGAPKPVEYLTRVQSLAIKRARGPRNILLLILLLLLIGLFFGITMVKLANPPPHPAVEQSS